MKAILCSDNAHLIFTKHNYSINKNANENDEFEPFSPYFKFMMVDDATADTAERREV